MSNGGLFKRLRSRLLSGVGPPAGRSCQDPRFFLRSGNERLDGESIMEGPAFSDGGRGSSEEREPPPGEASFSMEQVGVFCSRPAAKIHLALRT
ncbi:hypothetical protein SRHO_G00029270 [Serrasalmus rhombeus]